MSISQAADSDTKPSPKYESDKSGIYLIQKVTRTVGAGANALKVVEETKVPLTNFLAVIQEQWIIDDGDGDEKLRREYVIIGSTAGSGYRFNLTADQFFDIRRWVDRYIGAPATVFPAVHNYLDHAAAAIKLLSRIPPTVHVRTHTGWTEVADARGFLHQGGMIGLTIPGQVLTPDPAHAPKRRPTSSQARRTTSSSPGPIGPFSGPGHGPITSRTLLPEPLQKFDLPAPLTGDDRVLPVRLPESY